MKHLHNVKRLLIATVERDVGDASAPCTGRKRLRLQDGRVIYPDSIPLDGVNFGDEIDVHIEVWVTKRARRSRKKCHNHWPNHRHH